MLFPKKKSDKNRYRLESSNSCCAHENRMLRPNPQGLGRKISFDAMPEMIPSELTTLVNSGERRIFSGASESSVVLNVCEEYALWWRCRKSKAVMPRGTEWTASMGSRPKLAQLIPAFVSILSAAVMLCNAGNSPQT